MLFAFRAHPCSILLATTTYSLCQCSQACAEKVILSMSVLSLLSFFNYLFSTSVVTPLTTFYSPRLSLVEICFFSILNNLMCFLSFLLIFFVWFFIKVLFNYSCETSSRVRKYVILFAEAFYPDFSFRTIKSCTLLRKCVARSIYV